MDNLPSKITPKERNDQEIVKVDALTLADNQLQSFVQQQLGSANSIQEYQTLYDFLLKMRKEREELALSLEQKRNENLFNSENNKIELGKKRSQLFFYRAQRWVTLSCGIGLFGASFFIFPILPLMGGIFFGTGLSALGISTISLKKLTDKA